MPNVVQLPDRLLRHPWLRCWGTINSSYIYIPAVQEIAPGSTLHFPLWTLLLWFLISASVRWSGTRITLLWPFMLHWAWPPISGISLHEVPSKTLAAPVWARGPVSPTSAPSAGPVGQTSLPMSKTHWVTTSPSAGPAADLSRPHNTCVLSFDVWSLASIYVIQETQRSKPPLWPTRIFGLFSPDLVIEIFDEDKL